jgi:transposase, IS5 family
MDCCWLQGATGDALHAVLRAAGFNIPWLLRAIAAKELKRSLLVLSQWVLWQRWGASALRIAHASRAAPTRLFDLHAHQTLVAQS